MSLRERLKNETRENHERAETNLACLMSPTLSKEQYARVLHGMHAFHSWFENSLEQLPENYSAKEFYLTNRRKLEKVKTDLSKLGVLPPRQSLDFNLRSQQELNAGLWGMLYVIEGSTLGAQVIKKNLESVLGLSEDSGASYFSGYGVENGKMWQQFLKAMDNDSTREKPDVVVAAADQAFDLIDRSFQIAPIAMTSEV